jgi:hypothetical protein
MNSDVQVLLNWVSGPREEKLGTEVEEVSTT